MGKLFLGVILLVLVGCTKDAFSPGALAAGTKVNLIQGIFEPGQFQPTSPLTIQSIFSLDGKITIYNAVDAKGIVWQVPDNDLQIVP